jgi:hypothetical protein
VGKGWVWVIDGPDVEAKSGSVAVFVSTEPVSGLVFVVGSEVAGPFEESHFAAEVSAFAFDAKDGNGLAWWSERDVARSSGRACAFGFVVA